MSTDFWINNFVTNALKTHSLKENYKLIRATLKIDAQTDETPTYCSATTLEAVYKKHCLVHIVDIIVKTASPDPKLRRCAPINDLFNREAYFYETIMAELENLTNAKNLVAFQTVPTLMAGTTIEDEETLIFHCCGEQWYPKFEKYTGRLTAEHLNLVLDELSRFHALSFALKKLHRNKQEKFKERLKGGYLSTLRNSDTLRIIHKNLSASFPFFDDTTVQKLKKFDDEMDEFMDGVLQQKNDIDVLVHGDFTTNFQFSYKLDAERKMTDIVSRTKFFNWQLVKFGSPVLDLSSFIFTNYTLVDLDLKELLQKYHTNLKLTLKQFGFDVNEFLPFRRLEEEWKKCGKFGFALAFLKLTKVSLEELQKTNDGDEEVFFQSFIETRDEEFVKRVIEMVTFSSDTGLL